VIGAVSSTPIFGPMFEQPYPVGGPLRGRLAGLHSARRIIYRVEDEDHRIDIIRIHHGRVYR
jgi:mRNA-degrading endonuclease RelE of RelBE toxin-antitoxin system